MKSIHYQKLNGRAYKMNLMSRDAADGYYIYLNDMDICLQDESFRLINNLEDEGYNLTREEMRKLYG